MNRALPILLIVSLLLAACSSESFENAYTASGDGSQPADLARTASFAPDDDLNVVVDLGLHRRTLSVYAAFTSPDGSVYTTDPIEADDTVESILLGLDWESQGVAGWAAGQWEADIYIDNVIKETLTFTVRAPQPTAAPEATG